MTNASDNLEYDLADITIEPNTDSDGDENMEPTPDKLYPQPDGNKIELFERVDAVKLRYIVDHAEDFKLDEIVHTSKPLGMEAQLAILQKYLKKVKSIS